MQWNPAQPRRQRSITTTTTRIQGPYTAPRRAAIASRKPRIGLTWWQSRHFDPRAGHVISPQRRRIQLMAKPGPPTRMPSQRHRCSRDLKRNVCEPSGVRRSRRESRGVACGQSASSRHSSSRPRPHRKAPSTTTRLRRPRVTQAIRQVIPFGVAASEGAMAVPLWEPARGATPVAEQKPKGPPEANLPMARTSGVEPGRPNIGIPSTTTYAGDGTPASCPGRASREPRTSSRPGGVVVVHFVAGVAVVDVVHAYCHCR